MDSMLEDGRSYQFGAVSFAGAGGIPLPLAPVSSIGRSSSTAPRARTAYASSRSGSLWPMGSSSVACVVASSVDVRRSVSRESASVPVASSSPRVATGRASGKASAKTSAGSAAIAARFHVSDASRTASQHSAQMQRLDNMRGHSDTHTRAHTHRQQHAHAQAQAQVQVQAWQQGLPRARPHSSPRSGPLPAAAPVSLLDALLLHPAALSMHAE